MRGRWLPFALIIAACSRPTSVPQDDAVRIVSLSPGITETIAAIGAQERLIAVSAFCSAGPNVCDRPKVGHALRADLEAIAGLRPSLIVFESTEQGPGGDLSRIAPIARLPWLTLADIVTSTRRLGRRLGRAADADRIATRLERELGGPPTADGPEVLLVLGYPDATGTFWFLKPESLHGRLVSAVGGRPPKEIVGWRGPPKMTAEGLVRLDPEWIVLLGRDPTQTSTAAFARLTPLQAVKRRRVRRLVGPTVLSTSPAILDQIAPLAALLQEDHDG